MTVLLCVALVGASSAFSGMQADAESRRETEPGLRGALDARGLVFEGVLLLDHSTNLNGGLRRGSAFRYPLGLSIDVDTARLVGWSGGRLHLAAYAHHGASGARLVGDAQGFDNLDAAPFRGLFEAWCEQRLARGRVRVKAGRVDANTEFAAVESAAPFLHSSAGFSPTIVGFPSFPGPAPSVNVIADVAWLHLGLGAYRVNGFPASGNGSAPSASFVVAEAGARWRVAQRAGRLSIGRWRHGVTFERSSAGPARGTDGSYAVLEQDVRPRAFTDEPAIAVFVQAGQAGRDEVSDVDQHLGGGLVWPGVLPLRRADALGVLVSTVRFVEGGPSALRAGRETALELVYDARLGARLGLKADLQRISNPGGQGRRPALVGSLRAEVRF